MENKKNNKTQVSQDLNKIEELENKLVGILEKLKNLEDSHIQKDKKIEEYLDGWKRAQADLINYKKEERERLDKFRSLFSIEAVKNILLPVLDDLDRAIDSAPKDFIANNWFKGIVAIRDASTKNLEGLGIIRFAEAGDTFDPAMHEIVGTEENKNMENKIIKVIQKGYRSQNFIIRAAKIIVGGTHKKS